MAVHLLPRDPLPYTRTLPNGRLATSPRPHALWPQHPTSTPTVQWSTQSVIALVGAAGWTAQPQTLQVAQGKQILVTPESCD